MLFFFEAGFFVLAVAALVLAEVWGRSQALWLWTVVTVASLAASPVILARLASVPASDRTEARWRQAFADSWRHLNKLLLLGLVALAVWWWIGR